MGIIFDSRDALIRSGPVVTVREFDVLRDWRGLESPALLIDAPEDLVWSGSDHDSLVLEPGPYPDLDNGVHFISGPDSLVATPSVVVDFVDEHVEFGCWVKLDELPTVLVQTEIPFIRLTNTGSTAYLEGVFLLESNGSVTFRARFYTGVTTVTYTHPDAVDIVDWTFIAFHFHHVIGFGELRIWIDPGNDNLQGGGGDTVDIPAGTYDELELFRGSGEGPGNLRGVKFTDLMLMRNDVSDSTPTTIAFTTPGSGTNWVVPAGVTSIEAAMWAGGGGSGGWGEFGGSSGPGGTGGGGGFSKATHAVTPGESLEVWVGGGGGLGLGADFNANGTSGQGAGGGATSSVWRGVSPGGTVLQVGGGGAGGGGGDNSSATPGGQGGPGGGTTGVTGTGSQFAGPGQGGSQVAGGAGGVRTDGGPPPDGGIAGLAGTWFQGGDGADGNFSIVSHGGAANAGSTNGGAGGLESPAPNLGFAGGGGGGAGIYGGGGGSCSVSGDAGGGGGGGGSNFIVGTATAPTDQQGVLTTPGGTADPLYVFPVGYGANAPGFSGESGFNGADGRTYISYGATPSTWRQRIRDYATQAAFDTGVIVDAIPARYYRASEYDMGGGMGDRFVHSIAGFLNPALAPGGTIDRSVGSGPLDVSNSYRYQGGCIGTVDIHYVSVDTWDITHFCFFKQPVSPTSDGDWFVRFENDAGEYVQLERDGNDVRLRAFFSDLTTYVQTLSANSLLDGSWHRLVFKTSATITGWLVGVDGVNYLPAQPGVVPALSAPMTRMKFGNIDLNVALMGWANYQDLEILTTFTSQVTEASLRSYIQARTDAVPAGPDYYSGYLPQQDTLIGTA